MAMKANYIALPKSEREPVAGARLMSLANPDERMEVSVSTSPKGEEETGIRPSHFLSAVR
jgi:hypothetical protein